MSTDAPMSPAHLARPVPTTPTRLERAYRLYRRRARRCRTENQLNRVHIALDNYMTPAEVRYFATALGADPADSPSRRWIELLGAMPLNKARPIDFERRELLRGVTLYAADAGSIEQKTLIIGFAGLHHRLMAPTSWWLDCLNPTLYDVLVLRDFSQRTFVSGIPGLGKDYFEALSKLRSHVDWRAYRNAISLGTSVGGVPALLAAILLKLNRGIAICPQDFGWFAGRVRALGLDDQPYLRLISSRPHPFPELVVVHGAEKKDDALAALALHQLVPSHLWKVRKCAQHGVLKWHIQRGTLPAFLAKLLGQSLESRECLASDLSARWVVVPPAAPRRRGSSAPQSAGAQPTLSAIVTP